MGLDGRGCRHFEGSNSSSSRRLFVLSLSILSARIFVIALLSDVSEGKEGDAEKVFFCFLCVCVCVANW